MKVLLTGSRTWKKRGPIEALIKGMAADQVEFVFGDCPTGLDAIAWEYCKQHTIRHKRFEADWSNGKGGGPNRNGEMVAYCKASRQPTTCFGFRDEGLSPGTDNCLGQAWAAEISCYVIKPLDYSPIVPGTKRKSK